MSRELIWLDWFVKKIQRCVDYTHVGNSLKVEIVVTLLANVKISRDMTSTLLLLFR